MNGINSKDRFSFAKGYRARTIFLIFDILLLGILMCMMVLPLLKVIVDSIDPTSYGVRLWPKVHHCMGGVKTDTDCRVLDVRLQPIPGLYVSGNDCGRRFGTEYVTPIPGVSIAFAMVLGRECGKSVAKFLG